MTSALRTGINTLLKTVTGLSSSNVWHARAPHSADFPYCVFNGIDNTFDYDSGAQEETTHVQFSLFGASLTALEAIAASIRSIFDFGEASLTVSGYTVVRIDRTLDLPASIDNKVWQIVMEYEFIITKARS